MEVCFNGQWGTVCHDSWDRADAQTVCGILGYNDTAIQTTFSFFGDGANIEGPVFLDEVQCNGNETSILDCLSVAPGDHDCSHFIDAGVICSGRLCYTMWNINNDMIPHEVFSILS